MVYVLVPMVYEIEIVLGNMRLTFFVYKIWISSEPTLPTQISLSREI